MILEAVEERCLRYLGRTSNPLVPFDTLLAYIQRDEACAGIDADELLDFLRHHEFIRVLEPVGLAQDPAHAALLEAMGMPAGRRVVLLSRMPGQDELKEQMREQLGRMAQALETAQREAEAAGNEVRARAITHLLATVHKLGERLERF